MSFVLAALVVVGFALLVAALGLPGRARETAERARESLSVLRDPSLDDRSKERALQAQSLALFKLLGILAGGSLLAIGLPLLAVWGLEAMGVSSLGAVLGVLARVDFLAGTTVAGVLGYALIRRFGPA